MLLTAYHWMFHWSILLNWWLRGCEPKTKAHIPLWEKKYFYHTLFGPIFARFFEKLDRYFRESVENINMTKITSLNGLHRSI